MRAIIGVFALLLVQNDWHAADFKYRRNVRLDNKTSPDLKKGDVVYIEIDPGFLLAEKAKKDLSDLRLYYKDKEVPYCLSKKSTRYYVFFELEEPLKRKGSDANYYIYYGNPKAEAPKYDKERHFDGILTFDDKDDLKNLLVDKNIDCEVSGGNLFIKSASKDSTIRLRKPMTLKDSSIKIDFKLGQGSMHAVVFQVGVGLFYSKETSLTDEIKKKIAKIFERLDADDPQERESATKELIDMGPAIVPLIEKEIEKTKSAEVKWRLEFVMEELNKQFNKPHAEVKCAPYAGYMYTKFYVDGRDLTPNYLYHMSNTWNMHLAVSSEKIKYISQQQQKVEREFKEDLNQIVITFYEDAKDIEIGSISISKDTSSANKLTTDINIEETK